MHSAGLKIVSWPITIHFLERERVIKKEMELLKFIEKDLRVVICALIKKTTKNYLIINLHEQHKV